MTASVITERRGVPAYPGQQFIGRGRQYHHLRQYQRTEFHCGSKGQDASLTVDGVPIDSSSNTVANAIPGITLNLMDTTSSPVTLQVSPDTSQAASAINTFVSDYNTVISNLNSQFTSGGSSGTTGTLLGDSAAELSEHLIG